MRFGLVRPLALMSQPMASYNLRQLGIQMEPPLQEGQSPNQIYF